MVALQSGNNYGTDMMKKWEANKNVYSFKKTVWLQNIKVPLLPRSSWEALLWLKMT